MKKQSSLKYSPHRHLLPRFQNLLPLPLHLRPVWNPHHGPPKHNNRRFLLHGRETWYYENGTVQYEVEYQLGEKIGREIYRSFDGKNQWEWIHQDNGNSQWKQWWTNGKNKAESYWRDGKCEGMAKRWDNDGKLISEVEFVKGARVQ